MHCYFLPNIPQVIVRPEVRAAMRDQICPGFRGTTIKSYEFISPGEAILESQTDSLMVRMCSLAEGPFLECFCQIHFQRRSEGMAKIEHSQQRLT